MSLDSNARVLIAISGGVDSALTGSLLKTQGYDCHGVYMITCDQGLGELPQAQRVAKALNIPMHTLDLRDLFSDVILNYFLNEYKQARTPNPCVFCNKVVKFGKLWEFAKTLDCQHMATGHYASIKCFEDGPGICEADNKAKDQSYVLSLINRSVVEHILLPMAQFTKEQTKEQATRLGLGLEHKEESQEICFIPNDDYVALLEQHCPELVSEGLIVDCSGKQLGTHQGIHRFTIGQRRGLGVAMGVPYYVTHLDAATNTVILGPKDEVLHQTLKAKDVNWLTLPPTIPFNAKVKIRYNGRGSLARVTPQGESVLVDFEHPTLAITPGQAVVFYTREPANARVLGGGWIDSVKPQ
jgi:tRNA-specific 2-thiouridylase